MNWYFKFVERIAKNYLLRRGYPPSQVMRTVAALTGARPDGPDETS